MSEIAIQIAVPYLTVEQYSRFSGIPENTIRWMIQQGRLPIRSKIKPKEKPLINLLALMREANDQVI
ncbi:DNA-binding protein [Parashewanella curva]|uniref:DNA-binding protein n=1 Tax=Parashewanella curva TaxID=2338552 RepID=A0A3L8PV25_9GAMM|nr:DNA-binding protein [Parashewanella curva]RLV57892.1 DNA-binding protein [Parashewanella curva]